MKYLFFFFTVLLFVGSTHAQKTVAIGNQVWMLKNLDVDHYRNGDKIPEVKDTIAWSNLTTGAWCYFDNNPANGKIYGKLYNWYAVNDPRGLAPKGWHIPDKSEWTMLTIFLGGEDIVGGKMKEKGLIHWRSPNTGATNSSGFTGLPGSYRDNFWSNDGVGTNGGWRSVTEWYTKYAWHFYLSDHYDNIFIDWTYKTSGNSVRCVRN